MGLNNDNNIKADHIFINGRIYTENEDCPWATTVACKNGKILAAGDYGTLKSYEDDFTEMTDLKGKTMLPGFIDAHSSTVLSVFRDSYVALDSAWDSDTIMGEIADRCYDTYDDETVFGYGFHERILENYPAEDDKCRLLDEMEVENPVLLLCADGHHLWYNSLCREKIKRLSGKEDIDSLPVETILKLLMIFDYEELESNFADEKERLTDKGFTTVCNCCSPLCFDTFYHDYFSDSEGDMSSLDQKFYHTILLNRPFDDAELNKIFSKNGRSENCNTLKIIASEETFTREDLLRICLATAEKGFNIHADALDKKTLFSIYSVFDELRKKGFNEINLIIASDLKLSKEEKSNFDSADSFVLTYATDTLNNSVFSHCRNIHEAVDELTVKAAEIIGKGDVLGSIEAGKNADFTVFSEDVFKTDLATFSRLHSDMIVVDGEIRYDVDEENLDEMVNLLMNMQL